MTESRTLDADDLALVQALRHDGRVAFSAVADGLGVSEHTVARRYRRLRAAGAARVVGVVDGVRLGRRSWTVRIRCAPEAAGPIAGALARRADTFWVYVLSGGAEIACNTQPHDPDELLIATLPRGRGVLDVSAHELLPEREPGEPVELDDADRRMLDVLARDGRATHARLATATGRSPSTVSRRMRFLERAGVLGYAVETPAAAVGLRAEARLWMSARPAALAAVVAAVGAHPEVTFAAVTTGPTNVVAHVACRTSAGLYGYLTGRLAAVPGVDAVQSAPVLRTVKRFAAPL